MAKVGNAGGQAVRGIKSLTRSELKSVRKYNRLILEHKEKLAKYIADPAKFDHKGLLRNVYNPQIRQRIQNSYVKHLQDEIKAFEGNIAKIMNKRN